MRTTTILDDFEPLDSNAVRAVSRRLGNSESRVYFVSCGNGIKIGVSVNIRSRLCEMQTVSAGEIVLIGSIPGTRAFERAIHRRLRQYCLRGEWFRDCAEVRGTILGLISRGPVAIGLKPAATIIPSFDACDGIIGSDLDMVVCLGRLLVAMPRDELMTAAARARIKEKIVLRAASGIRVSADHYLRLSAAIGFDPITKFINEPRALANFDHQLLAVGVGLTRKLSNQTLRVAAQDMRSSFAAVSRLENGHLTSISTVLKACLYVGVHPFDYCRPADVSRETGHCNMTHNH